MEAASAVGLAVEHSGLLALVDTGLSSQSHSRDYWRGCRIRLEVAHHNHCRTARRNARHIAPVHSHCPSFDRLFAVHMNRVERTGIHSSAVLEADMHVHRTPYWSHLKIHTLTIYLAALIVGMSLSQMPIPDYDWIPR